MRKQYFGAHVTNPGRLVKILNEAERYGMTAVQICLTNPIRWINVQLNDEWVEEWENHPYRDKVKVFVHAPYTLNFLTPGHKGDATVHFIKDQLRAAGTIGAEGVILHCGSWKGQPYEDGLKLGQLRLEKALKDAPIKLLIENMASGVERKSLEVINDLIVPFLDTGKIGICWDTCHYYSAGNDIEDLTVLEYVHEMYDHLIDLVHLNDIDKSVKLGSGRDRHGNFGILEQSIKEVFMKFSAPMVVERGDTYELDMADMREWSKEKELIHTI